MSFEIESRARDCRGGEEGRRTSARLCAPTSRKPSKQRAPIPRITFLVCMCRQHPHFKVGKGVGMAKRTLNKLTDIAVKSAKLKPGRHSDGVDCIRPVSTVRSPMEAGSKRTFGFWLPVRRWMPFRTRPLPRTSLRRNSPPGSWHFPKASVRVAIRLSRDPPSVLSVAPFIQPLVISNRTAAPASSAVPRRCRGSVAASCSTMRPVRSSSPWRGSACRRNGCRLGWSRTAGRTGGLGASLDQAASEV